MRLAFNAGIGLVLALSTPLLSAEDAVELKGADAGGVQIRWVELPTPRTPASPSLPLSSPSAASVPAPPSPSQPSTSTSIPTNGPANITIIINSNGSTGAAAACCAECSAELPAATTSSCRECDKRPRLLAGLGDRTTGWINTRWNKFDRLAFDECERIWMKGEYLMWWSEGNRLPPLVTTSPSGTPRAEAGVLGFPDTTILLGDERVDGGLRNGGRITAGFWFDECQQTGLQATWFSLDEGDNLNFSETSPGTPILARPFFNVGLGAEDSHLVAFPNIVRGDIDVTTNSDIVSGEVVFRRRLFCRPRVRLDLLAGYRYMSFDEELSIVENLVSTNPGGLIQQGTTFDVFDRFETQNDFHGGDLGLALNWWRGPWRLDATANLSVGGIHRQLDIDGGTTVTVPGLPPVDSVGGLLALSTNIGSHTETDVAILPEYGIDLNCALTEELSVSLGYSLIVLTGVLRNGEQIDLAVDATGLPTASDAGGAGFGRPEARLNDSAMWLQGLSFGIELRR